MRNPLIGVMRDNMRQAYNKNNASKTDLDPIYGVSFRAVPLVIGMNVLSKLHLYVAYGENTLYVTAADASLTPPRPSNRPK